MTISARIGLIFVLICAAFFTSSTPKQPAAFADGFCFTSGPYADWRGQGIFISECDVQALLNGGDAQQLVIDGLGMPGPEGPALVTSIHLGLAALRATDRGNGVYVLTPFVGINSPMFYAA